MTAHALSAGFTQRLRARIRAFCALTKPRVVSLIVFTAVIGMFLATPGMVPPQLLIAGTLGIALVAGAAAAINCLVEQNIDALMQRTRWRPLPRGELTTAQTLAFAGALGGVGLWLLAHFVNPLTMWLTLATFVGYAVVYTLILKPATPQNIVIGGASGAMPPVLGWAAVTGEVSTEALLLFRRQHAVLECFGDRAIPALQEVIRRIRGASIQLNERAWLQGFAKAIA